MIFCMLQACLIKIENSGNSLTNKILLVIVEDNRNVDEGSRIKNKLLKKFNWNCLN